jgi:hypothetical protein
VWFNAWHHQQENHLLASLLTNIRGQAIPDGLNWANTVFRSNLLKLRYRKQWFLALLLFLFASTLASFLLKNHPEVLARAVENKKTDWRDLHGLLALAGGLAGGTLVTALMFIRRLLSSFGVDPSALLILKSGKASVRDLQIQTSFREQFAAEFKEVTTALNPRT